MPNWTEGRDGAKERYCSWIPLDYGTVGADRNRGRVKYTKTTASQRVDCASVRQRTGGKGCGAFSVTTKAVVATRETRKANNKRVSEAGYGTDSFLGEKYNASTIKQHVKARSLTQISSVGSGAAVPAKSASSLLQAKKVGGAAVSTQVRVLKTSMEDGVRVASQTVKRKLWEKVPETTAVRLALADKLRSRLHEVLTCENSCHNDGKNPHVSSVSGNRLQRCVAKNAGGTRGSGIRVVKAAGIPGTNVPRATVPTKERATVHKSRVSKTVVDAGILVSKVAEVGGLESDPSKSRLPVLRKRYTRNECMNAGVLVKVTKVSDLKRGSCGSRLPILKRRGTRAEVSTGTVSAQRLKGMIVRSKTQGTCALPPICEMQVIAGMTPNMEMDDRRNDVASAVMSRDRIGAGTRVDTVRSAAMIEKGKNVSSIRERERSISVMNDNSGGESPMAQILVQESSNNNEATPGTAFDTGAMLAVEAYFPPGACRCR